MKQLEEAICTIIIYEQNDSFVKEIHVLQLLKQNLLASLHPFIDHKNVLPVGKRLKYVLLKHDKTHLIIGSEKNKFVEMLTRQAHHRTLHRENQKTLALL